MATTMTTTMGTNWNMTTFDPLDCPDFTDDQFRSVEKFSFAVEGVTQTVISILGAIGNTMAVFVLSRREMRNVFNLLLVTLACFDTTYLFGSVLESFRKQFRMASHLHILLFPYLLYPLTQMAVTGSIFMTVAIALERYIAVHYPLNYNQAMHEANALVKRIFKYVSSVTLLSAAFTATRFLEAKVEYEPVVDEITNETIGWTPQLEPTSLRTAPYYTLYFNWSRLIVLGIVPFSMLVYLNFNIYRDIQARKRRRFDSRVGPPTPSNVQLKVNGKEPPKQEEAIPLVVMTTGTNGNTRTDTLLRPAEAASAGSRPSTPQTRRNTIAVNESRRKNEDHLAIIFMGFILVFLICHLPRLLLNIHELVTIQHAMECQKAGLKAFPLWSFIAIPVSHVLLVINSSTNIFIYCCLSSKFREEVAKVYHGLLRKMFQQ